MRMWRPALPKMVMHRYRIARMAVTPRAPADAIPRTHTGNDRSCTWQHSLKLETLGQVHASKLYFFATSSSQEEDCHAAHLQSLHCCIVTANVI